MLCKGTRFVFTKPSKNGGDLMYVDFGSHVYSLSEGATREFQRSLTFCNSIKNIEQLVTAVILTLNDIAHTLKLTLPQSFHRPP